MESNAYRYKVKRNEIVFQASLYIILAVMAVATLLPLVWALVASLRNDSEMFKYLMPFSLKTIIPQHVTFQAYINLFTVREFYRPVFNTLYVAVINIVAGGLINALAGFAFAKFHFRLKNFAFMIVMLSVMVPFEAIAIPLYSLVFSIGWIDTYYALLMPALANGLAIFLFKQFFEEIPDSLIESAIIDGAGWLRVFFRIMLPLSKPVLVSAGLMIFLGQWEAFLWPLIAARSENLKMIQVALTDFRMEHMTLWSELYAASIITAIIPILLLMPFQKYYRGIATSGLKE